VLEAVRHGLNNRQIAQRRGISLEGVKYHVANIVAKLGVANRRALKTWKGAARDSALVGQTREISMTDLSIQGVGQIGRSVRDVGASEGWYEQVLGLSHLYTFGNMAFFACGETRLMLTEKAPPLPAESILYLRVADIDATFDALQAKGVVFTGAPHMIHRHENGTEEWMAFFEDLEGRPMAIMAQIEAG
jgi:catechol 2,3-dioxygenase-like lactoylglutathione lyase family enzyme